LNPFACNKHMFYLISIKRVGRNSIRKHALLTFY
jgi:hypothetical protein